MDIPKVFDLSNKKPILLNEMKEQLLKSLAILKRYQKIDASGISIEMGYKRNYISEMLSPTGKVTEKFMNAFDSKYRSVLENPNLKMFATPSEFMRETAESLITLKATVKILTIKVIDLESTGTKRSFSKVSLELGEMIEQEINRRLAEFRTQ